MFNSMLVKFRARLSKSDADRTGRTMLCLLLVFTLLASAATVPIVPADPNRYLTDIKILSAPNMEGRGPGTKGLERASKYIEHRYNALGLQPAGSEGYLQPFTVTTGAKLKSDNDVTSRTVRRNSRSRSTRISSLSAFRHPDRLPAPWSSRATAHRRMSFNTTTMPAWM